MFIKMKKGYDFLFCVTLLGVVGLFALLFDKDKPNIELYKDPNGFDTDAKNFQKDFQNISGDFHKSKKRCL